jgi:hypothetical protein
MTIRKRAYAAGVFDGEGCVEVYRNKTGYSMCLTVANDDLRLLRFLAENFGGTIKMRGRHGRWYVRGEDSERFAIAILPFSIVKKEQLELYLELRDTCQLDYHRQRFSPKVAEYRASLVREIKEAKVILP